MANKPLVLNPWQLCDFEMLANGGFAPLTNFMGQQDYLRVVKEMRLSNDALWPMPITLDVSTEFAKDLILDDTVNLCSNEGTLLATLKVKEIWQPDKNQEAQYVFGSTDPSHAGVKQLLQRGEFYLSGELKKINLPTHYDFVEYRLTPQQLHKQLKTLSLKNLVGFQTRNPMHRAHFELTQRAAKMHNANLLIQPVVGMTKPGDVDYFTRVRCYQKIMPYYPNSIALLNFLPLAMRMAGPREALWHMLIRKNYGCTHFIIGRDHAGPGVDRQGKAFYAPYAAQELASQYQQEAGIQMVPFQEMAFSKSRRQYIPANEAKKDEEILKISGTEIRRRLREGLDIPEWFSYPEVIRELRQSFPAKAQQGITLFFTGLSGAGKSTIAKALIAKLMLLDKRKITLLDGDVVRKNISNGLGFSRQDRNANIARIAFVASEITKHGGLTICAQIAPYKEARQKARELISTQGAFIEIYISTPVLVCEQRDPKGLYKKVRAGIIKNFTGIDDPYEAPNNAEIVIDTKQLGVTDAVAKITDYLINQGYMTAEEKVTGATQLQSRKLEIA